MFILLLRYACHVIAAVKEAVPSDPVELMGWKDIPSVGDDFIEVKNEVSYVYWLICNSGAT